MRPALMVVLLALALAVPARPLHDFSAVDAGLQALMDRHGLSGASLRVGTMQGEVHRVHAGGFDDTTRVGIASASKWLSALTLARLVEAGHLRWDTRVGETFPEAPPAMHPITLAQLFSHTAGMHPDEAACLARRDTTLQACALDVLAMPLAYAPGTGFAYGGNSMQVAGAMAERATGRSWDEIFRSEMVQPLGLHDTDWSLGALRAGYVPNPNPRIGGGARSTLADYARVLDMVLAGGDVAGEPFLDASTLATMAVDRRRGLPILYSPIADPDQGYGIGQWVEARDAWGATTRVSSPGAFGFTPWVDWQQGSNGVIVVLGNGSAMRDELFDLQAACLDALDPKYRLFEAPLPPKEPLPRRAGPRPVLDVPQRAH